MSKEQIKKADFDNIFSTELYFLSHAEDITELADTITREEILEEFNKLTQNYANLLKQTKKLIKIGDSTQRKLRNAQVKLEEQNAMINAQYQKLRELNATKDKFFTIISHDIRNPITSILMMAEILRYSSDRLTKEELGDKIGSIVEAIKRVFALFDNLLRWSRSQTGSISFIPESIQLSVLIDKVITLLDVELTNKNIRFISRIPESLYLFGDRNMLETVFRNLISNAIKFTFSKGEIIVFTESINNDATIVVRDSGTGISHEDIKKLFKIDENFKSKGTSNEMGSGLGLILCKEFIEKHGGQIWVESTPGKGSDFKFTIPVA
jgi:two-component system, sensor histidine kinase and response regulator